jgi:hypothetical protein
MSEISSSGGAGGSANVKSGLGLRWRVLRAVGIGLGLCAVLVLAKAWMDRPTSRAICLGNLKQIEVPLTCCLPMEHKLKPGDPIAAKDLASFLPHGVIPKCPSGADYRIPLVAGGHPTCPYHGDLLAEDESKSRSSVKRSAHRP